MTIALRAAWTPQFTGLNRESCAIQFGICRCGIRIAERNINGRPTKFAAAIIDASLRTVSAIPCDRPAKVIARSAAAASTTSQPTHAAVDAHAEREPDEEQEQRLNHGDDAGTHDLREDDREARCGRGEEAVEHVPVEVG